MMEKCAKHDLMMKTGVAFVNTVHEQLERLLEYRVIINDESKENKMTCTVSLLVSLFIFIYLYLSIYNVCVFMYKKLYVI